MTLKVDFDREEDGRWIAVVESIPGCHVYGKTRQEALRKVEALALHAVAETRGWRGDGRGGDERDLRRSAAA
jgi:predicted RNase H-like HicB family nuclease